MDFRKPLAAIATAVIVGLAATSAQAAPPPGPHGQPEPDMLGVHWAKDHTPPPFAHGGTSLLSFHGGGVMTAGIQVQPIYWGTGWSSDAQSKSVWLAAFYSGVGIGPSGTPYMR